jgi:pimeloyl-ACP methyl ester carboxylesterase
MPLLERAGASIWYDHQPGPGPRVLLLMGLATSSDAWAPQRAGLADHTLAWLDARGIHRSGGGRGPLTVEQLAEDAQATLDALGWERAHVVGFSLGGLVAAELALRAPERVSSLVLACVGTLGHALPGPADLWRLARVRLGWGAVRDRAYADMLLSPRWQADAGPAAVAAAVEAFRHARDEGWQVHRGTLAMSRYDLRRRAAALQPPALLVQAGADRLISPAAVDALAGILPSAEVLRVEGAGHAITWEAADRFNAAVRAHVARAERAA